MACPTMRVSGVTADVWQCLREHAAELGINLPPGDAGSVQHPEGEADYVWDEITSMLLVTFTRKPDWISCNDIEARIRLAAATCGAP